jgi:transposase
VTLKVRARKFFCENRRCEREIFCERLPEVAAYGRKTERLEEALLSIAFELGGEVGARLARELGLRVSPDALLDRVRGAPSPNTDGVRVLRVDDFAFRRAQRYGTILVDLERHKVVDLLPERSAEVLERWLRQHPGVRIIARDRYGPYIDGANRGAPNAIHVADRWHLLKNLSETVEKVLERNTSRLSEVRIPEAGPEEPEEEPHGPKLPRPVANYVGWCWRKGFRDVGRIWEEVSGAFFAANREGFDAFVELLQAGVTMPVPKSKRKKKRRSASIRPSPAQAARMLVREAERLSSSDWRYLENLKETCPEAAEAHDLAQRFGCMVRKRTPEMLDGWLEEASKSELPELRSFAVSLKRDEAAVRAALSLPWSGGQVEGQIHRLKLIKRQGYGRAGFELLKRRVLGAA